MIVIKRGCIMPKTLLAVLLASVSWLFALTASGDEIQQRIKQCKEDVWGEFNLVVEEYKEKVPQEIMKNLKDKESDRQFFEEWGRRIVKEAEDMGRQKLEAQLDTLPNTAEGLAECEAMLPPKEKRRKK
jgi:hypothetical protein